MKTRLLGLVVLAVAVVAIRALYGHVGRPNAPAAIDFLLTAIGFLTASAGSALVLAGHAVFEPYDWPSLAYSPWRAIFRDRRPSGDSRRRAR